MRNVTSESKIGSIRLPIKIIVVIVTTLIMIANCKLEVNSYDTEFTSGAEDATVNCVVGLEKHLLEVRAISELGLEGNGGKTL